MLLHFGETTRWREDMVDLEQAPHENGLEDPIVEDLQKATVSDPLQTTGEHHAPGSR